MTMMVLFNAAYSQELNPDRHYTEHPDDFDGLAEGAYTDFDLGELLDPDDEGLEGDD